MNVQRTPFVLAFGPGQMCPALAGLIAIRDGNFCKNTVPIFNENVQRC